MKNTKRFDAIRHLGSEEVYFKRLVNGQKVIRYFDTINDFKERRREAVAAEVNNRFCANADERGRLPTDFRTSAFDLFTNWLAKVVVDENNNPIGIWRQGMRATYLKVLVHIHSYRMKAAKQYAAGYFEKPCFLNG